MLQDKALGTAKSRENTSFALFCMGFFLMPWVWGLNFLVFRHAFRKPEQKRSRFYVLFSLCGFLIESALVLVWMIIYFSVYKHASKGFRCSVELILLIPDSYFDVL
ncbi:MAG: hypothetical protein EZS28_033011 [Streblomastix strix]|uniref:Gamma-secretase subunit PEN-2 n=1 Tax=Streblomastix strix TaxID=222440 RepID=A0A5J4UMZ9_9EUKA|nr:MAG: hypothetical protein EZS28_033011 [Streblomastix strix]